MLALDKIRAIAPEQLDRGARVLAAALCMLPSLHRAQETYRNLGVPYTDTQLTEQQVAKLAEEGYIPDSTVMEASDRRKRLRRDEAIRQTVQKKLQDLNPQVAGLIAG